MKKLILPFIIVLFLSNWLYSQETRESDFRISVTVEPVNFAFKGHSVWLGFRYKQIEAGLFSFSIHTKNVPLFENGDKLDIKLQNGLAFYTRWYVLNKPSSPFIGFALGSEKWRIRNKTTTNSENIFKNAYFTPQIGYQWTTLNNHLIINPNLRFIFPFNPKGEKNIDGIDYDLKSFGFIPALDLGVGFHFD